MGVQEFDFFHELIAHEEITRIGCPGFQDGLGSGMVIGLPPVLHFGTKELAAKVPPSRSPCLELARPYVACDVPSDLLCAFGGTRCQIVPEVLLGKKRICLAISEPHAGSDVAGLQTTAVKSPCGWGTNLVMRLNDLSAPWFCLILHQGLL
jgi:alkylation response protein AidB-like acyl-CoA dehydrogenase